MSSTNNYPFHSSTASTSNTSLHSSMQSNTRQSPPSSVGDNPSLLKLLISSDGGDSPAVPNSPAKSGSALLQWSENVYYGFKTSQPEKHLVLASLVLHTQSRAPHMRSPLSSITSEEQAEFDALAKPNTGAVQPSGSPHPRPRRNSVNVASIIAEPNDLSPVIEGVRLSPSPPPTVSMQNAVAAWNGRIACLFEESRAAEALSLLDIMLQDNTPRPEASTYAVVIQGFCRLGDLGSALGWFERLLYQPPTSYAPRPNRESWTAILRCLVEKRDVLTVNSLFPALLTSTPAIKVEAEDFELLLKANTTSVHSFTIAKDELRDSISFLVDALKSVKSATSLELPASSAAFTDAIESLSRLEKTVSAKATELAIVTDTPAPAEDESFHYQGSVSPPPVESTDSTYVTQSPSHYGAPLPPPSMISIRLSRTLDDLLRTPYPRPSQINKAYDILLSHSASPGQFPAPETLGRLINSLGRLHDIPKLQSVYSIAQTVLYSLSADPEKQRYSWFHIEDQVVEAYAHANDFNSSAFHRLRMISLGGVPSADAYGAVISNIKDTTDDATLALDIYHESQRVGTRPSTFLYNTIISKLSRARKAKQVLLLFQRMLDEGLSPSSVTYGAVICACCRVGDGDRARGLFEEMVAMKNFKPQATPYNTMMQYYVQIDPNRQKVLYFYTAMRKAGVRPTEHTYKLLIDCYGTIEPVSVSLMESTFASLVSDSSVRVQGCHWASLLNAHGCVLKDLSSALSIFASIPSPPDPIVWETMINVYVSNDRSADLLPQFVDKMKMEGVRMTAYIANALIKGYSSCDEIGRARDVFDEMEDPPRGFAGLFNRSAHEGEDRLPAPQGCPVYREPSTWETMVKAEMEAGEQARAAKLLERMSARMFPDALTARVRRLVYQERDDGHENLSDR